ncbi:hypothetical protein CPB85DRAFT_609655 [Mucidula mucida]|nr:hypothetical protein CPB85DRAFT_609655 [Mucidula mucida]
MNLFPFLCILVGHARGVETPKPKFSTYLTSLKPGPDALCSQEVVRNNVYHIFKHRELYFTDNRRYATMIKHWHSARLTGEH